MSKKKIVLASAVLVSSMALYQAARLVTIDQLAHAAAPEAARRIADGQPEQATTESILKSRGHCRNSALPIKRRRTFSNRDVLPSPVPL